MQKNTNYFLIAEEKFLCNVDGTLAVVNDAILATLQFQKIISQAIAVDSVQQLHVLPVQQKILDGYQWLGLRTQLGQISEADFQIAGRALQLVRWYFEHQFCGRCGSPTQPHSSDAAKTCVNCKLDFYPRLSPCIITLVIRGDYCLLARHVRTASERYSCLAGFVEAGESAEQTIVREVMEEVGVSIDNIRYLTSQAWPFPGQLMLGYFADYRAGDIRVDPTEILMADWFHYDNLPMTPPAGTISAHLINEFVQRQKLLHSTMK